MGLAVVVLAVRRWARRPRFRARPAIDPVLLERVRREALSEDIAPSILDPDARSPLELERESLYAALRELDFDYRSGKLSQTDYEALREDYEARTANVLAELDQGQLTPPPIAHMPAPEHPAAMPPPAPRLWPRHPWRLVAGSVFLVAFALALGYFLGQSVRPRLGTQDTITGDFLTGTGPGGIAPGSQGAGSDIDRLLASGRVAYERQNWRAAIDAFKQVLALDGENPEAHASLGLILLQAGHGDAALLAIERALAKAPNDPMALRGPSPRIAPWLVRAQTGG